MNAEKMCDCNQGRLPCTCNAEAAHGMQASAAKLRIDRQANATPPAVGEFALQERAQLLERIAELEQRIKGCTFCGSDEHMTAVCPMRIDEQAREIERLWSDRRRDADLITNMRSELTALKAQPSGVVLPPHANTGAAIQGILQAIGIDGDVSYHHAGQVWNACLDEVARLNSSPVKAGDLAAPNDAELLELSRQCESMKGGVGMLYANYGREVLRRYGSRPVIAGGVDERAREALRKIMEAHRFNVAGMTVTEVHAICFDALTAPAPNHSEQVREVPEGYVLVPQRMELMPTDIASIMFHCGGDEEATEVDEMFVGGILWVGGIKDDDDKLVHGLHIATADYPEEGSTTLVEFAAAPSAGSRGGDL